MAKDNDYYLKWLKNRSVIYDTITGLPFIGKEIENIRPIVMESGKAEIIFFSFMEVVERTIGWENFDRLLVKITAVLKKILPEGTILTSAGPNFGATLIIIPLSGKFFNTSMDYYYEEINGKVKEIIQNEPLIKNIESPYRIGKSIIVYNPISRFERQLFYNIVEAIKDALQFEEATRKKKVREIEWIVKNNMLLTYFQPIVSLRSYNILGFEALSRVKNSKLFHSSEYLFNFALNTDVIYDLERQCRKNAVQNYTKLDNYLLFINLSPRSVYDSELTSDMFLEYVNSKGLLPENIVFEITERVGIIDFSSFKDALDKMRKKGFRIGIDDMGTGYSSLHTVAEINPDFIKYDMALVKGIEFNNIKKAIVETLVPFSEKINATVIAEGIESIREYKTLKSLGVKYGQGFLFALPKKPPLSVELNRVNE